MNSDRLRLYIIEFSLILVLLLALIFNDSIISIYGNSNKIY